MSKSILKNTIYRVLLNICNFCTPLIISPYLARLLDEDLYGIYNKSNSELFIFTTIASFGIYNFAVRELAKIRDDKEKSEKLFTSLYIIKCIVTIISILVYFIYVITNKSDIEFNIYTILSLQLFAHFMMVEWMNESNENYGFITIKTIAIKIITILGIFIFVKKPTDIIMYSIIVSTTQLLNNFSSFIYVKYKYKFIFKDIHIKKYIKPLTIIFFISNAYLFYSQLDKIMLGRYASNSSVTRYVIPQNLTTVIFNFLISMIMVTVPRLSFYLKKKRIEEYNNLLNESIDISLFISIPVFIGISCIAEPVMQLYAGNKYLDSFPVLIVFSIRSLLMVYYYVFVNQVLYIFKKDKVILRALIIYGVLNVLLKILLIDFNIFVPLTAILSTLFVELLLNIHLFIVIKKYINVDLNLFKRKYILYYALAVSFLPISLIINMLVIKYYIKMIIIIIICSLEYFMILLLLRDDTLKKIVNLLYKKFKH